MAGWYLRVLGQYRPVVIHQCGGSPGYFYAVGNDLTETQKNQFLSAYRKTFRSKDHGRALKSLYAEFANRYGVDVAALQTLAGQDLADYPKKYARLRHALPALQAQMAGSQAPKPVADSSPKGVGRVVCLVCGDSVHTNENGTVKLHEVEGQDGVVSCPGAGLKVVPPITNEKRPDDRSDSRSIRTVTSGLGSLGKR